MSNEWISELDAQPRIFASDFPAEEQDAVWHIVGLLSNLELLIRQFRAAVSLFDRSRAEWNTPSRPEDAYQYQFMAARDGAITIYHFAHTIQGIRDSQRKTPVFRGLVDDEAIRIAAKKLASFFPRIEDVRHAVAHSAELIATPEKRDRNWGLENSIVLGGQVIVVECLQDRTFITTMEGERVSYDLSVLTSERLVGIKREIFAAFQGAAKGRWGIITGQQ